MYYIASFAIAFSVAAAIYLSVRKKEKPEPKVERPVSPTKTYFEPELEAIIATAKYFKEKDTQKGPSYLTAIDMIRKNPNREQPKPNGEKMAELRRKALREVR